MSADITISRFYRARQTLGEIITRSGWRCLSLELPWLGNVNNRSCIPEGVYRYRKAPSPRLKGRIVIWIDNVPDRTNVQIHPGNFTSDLRGCAAPGDGIRDLNADGVWDVTNSGPTFDALLSKVPDTGTIRFTDSPKPGRGVYV
jgi:hypothetical protein